MKLIQSCDELKAWIGSNVAADKSIGFVPTMGALHMGHISLVKKAIQLNDIIIVSIFVNPTQFNDPKDLEKYPRTMEEDMALLSAYKIDVIFAPSVNEIYPNGEKSNTKYNLGGLDTYMEGAHRPGHFNGVVQVVLRLLDLIKPNSLYMGQKDFQQFSIIQYVLKDLNLPVELVVCPIKREANGLAMSSRNERLSPLARANASIIYKCLKRSKVLLISQSVEKVKNYVEKKFEKTSFELEYFDIVDVFTLSPINDISQSEYVAACIAVSIEKIRLIDNIIIKYPKVK